MWCVHIYCVKVLLNCSRVKYLSLNPNILFLQFNFNGKLSYLSDFLNRHTCTSR